MFERTHPLKTLRETSGISQSQIAKMTGITTTRISLAENHLGTLTLEETQRIRNAIVEVTHGRSAAVARCIELERACNGNKFAAR
jgi:transcriptional regulator with XRE-family HTH domain